MKRRRHTPEQIIRKLREAERMLGEGKTIPEAAKELGISEQTYHRWRNQYGGMKANDAKRLKDSVSATPKWANFGPRQRRVTARALLKTGLGAVWLARGPDETHKHSYDHVRDAIRGIGDVPLQYGFGNSGLPGHALQIMTISPESTPGLRVEFDYFGVKLWVLSAGHREQANAEFLRREIDVEFAGKGQEGTSEPDRHGPAAPSAARSLRSVAD